MMYDLFRLLTQLVNCVFGVFYEHMFPLPSPKGNTIYHHETSADKSIDVSVVEVYIAISTECIDLHS